MDGDKTLGCLCLCGLKFKSLQRDKCPEHLKNWEKWMIERKQIYKRLAKKLNTKCENLLINQGDSCREVKEEKLLLEYAKIETHFDKYRGNPTFWKLPYRLKDSDCFAVKTAADKHEIPDIEYVGVPKKIVVEKGTSSKIRNLKNLWRNSAYKKQVLETLSEKILEVQPHKPDLNLLIQGFNESSLKEIQKTIEMTHCKELQAPRLHLNETTTSSNLNVPETVISIKINHKYLDKQSIFPSNFDKLCLMFEYFIDEPIPEEQTIFFENTGQTVLRLKLVEYKKMRIFREFSDKTCIFEPFKFNRCEMILLPGNKKGLPIWFQVDQPGNFMEHWEITTSPKIWPYPDVRFIVTLKGFAYVKNFNHKVHQIREKLNQNMRNTCIKDFLNNAISEVCYNQPTVEIYDAFQYNEKELFEIANMNIHIPKYVYDQKIIEALKDFYKEVRCSGDARQWSLNITDLVNLARKKDIIMYFEGRLKAYEKAKMQRKALKEAVIDVKAKSPAMKPKNESKNGKKKDSLPEPSHMTDEPSYYQKLFVILQKLEKPSIYPNEERDKYHFCYLIVRTLFWKMFDSLDRLSGNNLSSLPVSSEPQQTHNTNISITKDRLNFEIFDEGYILRTKRIPFVVNSSKAKPKPLQLQNVPSEDIKKIFKIYFGKGEEGGKQKGKELKKEDTSKKKNKKGDNKKEPEQELINSNLIYPDFDPFAEEFKIEKTIEKSQMSNKTSCLDPISEDKYLIVYTTLQEVVDSMVDTIEGLRDKHIPSDTLYELLKCADDKILTTASTKSLVSKESRTLSQTEYFEFLQEIHWQSNAKMQRYFIQEEPVKSSSSTTSKSGSAEVIFENIFNLQDYTRKSEPYCLKEQEAQTEFEMENRKDADTEESLSSKLKSETSLAASLKSSNSKNMFYFLDNNNLSEEKENESIYNV
ncbi:hypothetical protein ABEB36_013037 [Hypothenemus hampei]|uniref:Uncharacterized protein n=1 Tax=Hypothenemus hampei TaxID=57062 RepID=A0ABD1E8P2_HYPHA